MTFRNPLIVSLFNVLPQATPQQQTQFLPQCGGMGSYTDEESKPFSLECLTLDLLFISSPCQDAHQCPALLKVQALPQTQEGGR